MSVIKIYGVKAENQPCVHWYRLASKAQEHRDKANLLTHPDNPQFFIVTALYDDGTTD